MITLVYGHHHELKPKLLVNANLVSDYSEIIYETSFRKAANVIAEHSGNIEKIIIEKGMPNAELIKGAAEAETPRIPYETLNNKLLLKMIREKNLNNNLPSNQDGSVAQPG